MMHKGSGFIPVLFLIRAPWNMLYLISIPWKIYWNNSRPTHSYPPLCTPYARCFLAKCNVYYNISLHLKTLPRCVATAILVKGGPTHNN